MTFIALLQGRAVPQASPPHEEVRGGLSASGASQ